MENKEKKAIQKTLLDLQEDLEPRDVAPFLWQHNFLTQWQFEELTESKSPRHIRCLQLVTIILSEESRCTFQGLLAALRYKNAYSFLADKLEHQLQNLRIEDCEAVPNGAAGRNTGNEQRQSSSREHVIYSRDAGVSANARLYEPVKKIDVFKANRAKMAELAHKLKRLSHDGNVDMFRQLVTKIDRIYKRNKLDAVRDIEERMEFADMRFIALEAEASSRRVSYDVTLYGDPVFGDMESVIPYTTNPRVSSMTYLARYGSAVSMLESIDNGLAILQYSKHHAEHVVPCKETGMVYYIEVNLLSQKYEKEPNMDLKMKILKTAEVAMSQFNGEDEAVQKDYQRMLMLKMVFCRLGIGLFGNKIENVDLEETDTEAAKDYLDFIERPDVWRGMEKRRKMLFQVAKSELYHQRKQFELALPHAKEAVRVAEENRWNAELPNLMKRLEVIDNALNKRSINSPATRDPIESWLDEFDDESLESGERTYETVENRRANDGHTDMQYLKHPRDHSGGIDEDALNMLDLKLGPEGERTTDQIPNMQYLKSPCDQSPQNSATEMENLKPKACDSRLTASPLTGMLDLKSPCDQSPEMIKRATEMEYLKLKACYNRLTASPLTGMQYLKSPCDQSPQNSATEMENLKLKACDSRLTASPLTGMHYLKSPCDQSPQNSATEMENLKLKACDSGFTASPFTGMQYLKSPGYQSSEMINSATEMENLKLKACDSKLTGSPLTGMRYLKSPGHQSPEMINSATEMENLKLKACDSKLTGSPLTGMQYLKSPGCQSPEMINSATEMENLKLKACDSKLTGSPLTCMQYLISPGCESNRDEDVHQLMNLKSDFPVPNTDTTSSHSLRVHHPNMTPNQHET